MPNSIDMGNDWRQNVYYKIVLNDSTQILFVFHSPTCQTNWGADNTADKCVIIGVDVNGPKNPNTYGRDMFFFGLKKTGLFPLGCVEDKCNSSNSFGCACKVLREGAMNY